MQILEWKLGVFASNLNHLYLFLDSLTDLKANYTHQGFIENADRIDQILGSMQSCTTTFVEFKSGPTIWDPCWDEVILDIERLILPNDNLNGGFTALAQDYIFDLNLNWGAEYYTYRYISECYGQEPDEVEIELEDIGMSKETKEYKCDCGAEKSNSTHATWCSTNQKP